MLIKHMSIENSAIYNYVRHCFTSFLVILFWSINNDLLQLYDENIQNGVSYIEINDYVTFSFLFKYRIGPFVEYEPVMWISLLNEQKM